MAPLILSVFPTFAFGGAQTRFATLATHFGTSFRHAIISMDGNTACRTRLSDELDVSFPQIEVRKGRTMANVWRFRRLLRELKPDVLMTSNWGSLEWAMANALRLARHVHVEDGFGPEERTAQLWRRVLIRRLLLQRSTVVLPSQTLWRIATEVWRLDPRQLRYIPNGIDLPQFQSDAALPRFPGEGPVIGTVAVLRAEKNLSRLLNAFHIVTRSQPARLVIVGDGPERRALEALAGKLGLDASVHFIGHVENPQYLYRGFDLFALSSDTEQMPLSVLEAMAAGLPVAATNVGDVRTMLGPENVPFVVPCDEAALAAVLQRLLTDPALRRRLGDANRTKAVRDYDRSAMFEAWRGLFDGRRRGATGF